MLDKADTSRATATADQSCIHIHSVIMVNVLMKNQLIPTVLSFHTEIKIQSMR